MAIASLTPSEALASLHSRIDGLSEAEVIRRRSEFGWNQIERQVPHSLLKRWLKEFTHFFALILWVAAGLCFVAEYLQPGEGMLSLGFAVFAVIVINAVFSFWQEHKAEQALAALKDLLPRLCPVWREGACQPRPIAELVPGDVIEIAEGDQIPADARVLEGAQLRVNTATITGESRPRRREAEPSLVRELMEAPNILLAGTSVVTGHGKALVFATGSHTEFGQIAELTLSTEKSQSPLQQEITYVSHVIAILASLLGLIFFMIGKSAGLTLWQAFLFGIGILVANVPEGLLPTVTLALALGAQRMAKRQVLIRHLPAVETLGSTTVICTDKTGTLTRNEMAVTHLNGTDITLSATAWQEKTQLTRSERALLEAMRDNHSVSSSEQDPEHWRGDPLEIALVRFASFWRPQILPRPRLGEITFDGERRRQSVLVAAGNDCVLTVKGAPEVLVTLCTQTFAFDVPQAMTEADRKLILAHATEMARTGLRVIAFAQRQWPRDKTPVLEEALESELIFLGLAGLEDPLRAEVEQAMSQCRAAGIRVIMITGDHPETARALAEQAGIFQSADAHVILGETLDRWTGSQLQMALDAPEIAFARVRADQKMKIVMALKEKREVVAVTGDGVNDAPALKKADIGIAMGLNGTDVARESADMVLLDDNFASIVAAIEEGRTVFANVRKFLTYILSSNVPEALPYLAYILFRIPLPLTIIQILAIDLGTDMVPALGLGAERPDPGVMLEAPRRRDQRLLDMPLVLRAYLWLGLWEAIAAMGAYFLILKQGGWQWGQSLPTHDPLYRQATTATFVAIILMQVVNVFLCRFHGRFALDKLWRWNQLIAWGVGIEALFIAMIVGLPWLQPYLQTTALPPIFWEALGPFMLLFLLCELIRLRLFTRSRA